MAERIMLERDLILKPQLNLKWSTVVKLGVKWKQGVMGEQILPEWDLPRALKPRINLKWSIVVKLGVKRKRGVTVEQVMRLTLNPRAILSWIPKRANLRGAAIC